MVVMGLFLMESIENIPLDKQGFKNHREAKEKMEYLNLLLDDSQEVYGDDLFIQQVGYRKKDQQRIFLIKNLIINKLITFIKSILL